MNVIFKIREKYKIIEGYFYKDENKLKINFPDTISLFHISEINLNSPIN